MKIYISEKDFDTCGEKIETFNDVDLGLFDSVWNAYDIVETIERGAIITPLEKHEAEIRKPLEDEIERLNNLIEQHSSRLDFYENIRRGRKGPHQTISEIVKEYSSLIEVLTNQKAKEITPIKIEDAQGLIPLLRNQGYKKAVAELEEWVEDTLSIQAFGKTLIEYENIKQKLNEMKGE